MAIRLVDEVPCLLGPKNPRKKIISQLISEYFQNFLGLRASLSHVALDPGYNFWKEYILRFLKTPPFKNLNEALRLGIFGRSWLLLLNGVSVTLGWSRFITTEHSQPELLGVHFHIWPPGGVISSIFTSRRQCTNVQVLDYTSLCTNSGNDKPISWKDWQIIQHWYFNLKKNFYFILLFFNTTNKESTSISCIISV